MPMKVRCKQCQAVLTVSDKARGRAVKCRQCGGRVQVGTGQGKSRPQAQKRRRPASPDNLFGGLDLNAAEDTSQKICPSCTKVVDEEDVVCSNCGVTVETGVLSERERIRRARNAPPPEEFYGDIWGNSWKFMRANAGWAARTAVVWALTATMAICSVFTLVWYLDSREAELRKSGKGMITIMDDSVVIDLSEDPESGEAVYDGKRYTKSSVNANLKLTLPGPRTGAMRSPPSLFWSLILLVSALGFGGWAWTLAVQIVKTTMSRGKTLKRFHTDLFGSMAMGFRSIFWPAVLLWPFLVIPLLILQFTGNVIAAGIVCACFYAIPLLLFLPSALVHLTQKYTYRAWLLNWVSLDFIKTILPTLYVSSLMIGLVLLIPLASAILMALFYDSMTAFYTVNVETQILASLVEYTPKSGVTFFSFAFLRLPLMATITFTGSMIVCGMLAFPALFMMRVYGLFGYYFRPDLSLINEQTELAPAGFGPRFLASLIDSLLLLVMAGVAYFCGTYTTKLFAGLYGFTEGTVLIASIAFTVAFTLVLWGTYFATWESGQNRATLGKVALGMIVLTDKDEALTLNKALGRAAAGLLTMSTLFIGFAMCTFHPGRRSLHDIITKTKVVWRGEGDDR